MNRLIATSLLLAAALASPALGQTFSSTPDSNLKGNDATKPEPGQSFSSTPPPPAPPDNSPVRPQDPACSDPAGCDSRRDERDSREAAAPMIPQPSPESSMSPTDGQQEEQAPLPGDPQP